MITIAVIEKNDCVFDRMSDFASELLYTEHDSKTIQEIKEKINQYIWSTIEPYVRFVQVSDDQHDFLHDICQELTKCFPDRKIDSDFYYHTEGSYSFPKRYIEFFHCQPLWKEYQQGKEENMNKLACLFSLTHNVIENTCVVIANNYDLSAPHFTKLNSITQDDITRVIRRRFFFSAVLIKEDSFVKYYYQNPSYLIGKIYGLTDQDQIQKFSTSLLKYNLTFYFQHQKSKYVNKIATRINGSYQLHGDVLMLHELEEGIYANLSLHEAKRLNVLSYGRLYDRTLKNEEIHTIPAVEVDKDGNQVEKKVTPYWSRYIVVSKRMETWKEQKNKCINCSKEMKNPLTCSRCFRIKFCSSVCQKEFDHYHHEECINPASL